MIIVLLMLCCSLFSTGQNGGYLPPVKIPILLSGSFAELRSDHFHSGIDIKTQGVKGIDIHSIADGYVSRIVVSPTGYGKALYINHPNGTTSVYGHLESFGDDISEYVLNSQYKKKSFKVDLQIPTGLFKINKDDIVAKSGNSGSSGGPHLHFEIRDTKTEKPLNPLKYNFEIKDNIPPKVLSLMMVPLSDSSHVLGETRNRRFNIVFYDGKYHIKNNPAVPVYGEVGFAVEANDYFNDSWNKCGLYSLQLTVDEELYFSQQLDQFSFAESRYINSYIDYEMYIEKRRRFQKTWIEPGNKLSTYNFRKDNGAFVASGNQTHKIRIQLKDTYGNTSTLEFNVKSQEKEIKSDSEKHLKKFNYNTDNLYNTDAFSLSIPKGSLYKNLNFQYKTMPISPGFYSEIHVVHKNTVPLHKSASIKIKTKNLPTEYTSKAVLVNIDDATGNYWAIGGKYENGWITSNIRTFGQYAVKIDTIPPVIRSLSIKSNEELTEPNRIRFKISDDLSGINEIKGYLDGEWALFDYDPKNSLITHSFDKKRFEFNKKHNIVLKVSDYKGNTSTYEATFRK